jgi:hypothetical protein
MQIHPTNGQVCKPTCHYRGAMRSDCAPYLLRDLAALQVLVNGTWGEACSFGPPGDLRAATVVCKELGLGSHGYLYNETREASFANAPPSWIENATCAGGESKLEECDVVRTWPDWGNCGLKIIDCAQEARGEWLV